MKRRDPFKKIDHLISHVGFSSKQELGSFCLAVGLFNESLNDRKTGPPKNWNPSNYEIWPLVQIIAYTIDPGIGDTAQMKGFLYPYLLSGIDIVEKVVDGKSGSEAYENISKLIPP